MADFIDGCVTAPKIQRIKICELADLPLLACREFHFSDSNGQETKGFVINAGQQLVAFKNACPHWGIELNWQPDRFLNFNKSHVICAVHGALFQIDDGLCIDGPCVFRKLQTYPVAVEKGVLYVLIKEPGNQNLQAAQRNIGDVI